MRGGHARGSLPGASEVPCRCYSRPAEPSWRFPAVNEPCNGPIPLRNCGSQQILIRWRAQLRIWEHGISSVILICAERRRCHHVREVTRDFFNDRGGRPPGRRDHCAPHERRDARRHDHRAVPARASRAGDQARRARARARRSGRPTRATPSRLWSRRRRHAREPRGGRRDRAGRVRCLPRARPAAASLSRWWSSRPRTSPRRWRAPARAACS